MATILAGKTALRLRLYIAGNAPNSLLAISNLKAICDEYFAIGCVVETIDLLVHPARALADSRCVRARNVTAGLSRHRTTGYGPSMANPKSRS